MGNFIYSMRVHARTSLVHACICVLIVVFFSYQFRRKILKHDKDVTRMGEPTQVRNYRSFEPCVRALVKFWQKQGEKVKNNA